MEIETRPARGVRARLGSALMTVTSVLVSLVAIGFILPAAFGLERYVIAGGSMTGSISRGSVVFEEKVPVTDLQVGDVITYVPPADSGIDHLVTHRIRSIDGETFRTKGDANADADPWTFQLTAATQPRVVAHVPVVGYAFLALQDRSTRMIAVGLPALLVALLSLRELVRGLRRNRVEPARVIDADATDVETPELVPVPRQRDELVSVTTRPRALSTTIVES